MTTSNRIIHNIQHGTSALPCGMIMVLCMLFIPASAQPPAQRNPDMYSTSMYINPSGNCYAETAGMSECSDYMESSWVPCSYDYCITPVGAANAADIGYANDHADDTGQGPRRVSPGGGLGEPGAGLPIGDIPVWFVLLFAALCALHIHHKTQSASRN